MSMWETTSKLTNQYGKSKPIKINSSIFPGDFLFSILNTLVKKTKPNRI